MTKPWEETWEGEFDGTVVRTDDTADLPYAVGGMDSSSRGRLAAAAPKLYRALAELVRWEDEDSCHSGMPGDALSDARNALKKARGET